MSKIKIAIIIICSIFILATGGLIGYNLYKINNKPIGIKITSLSHKTNYYLGEHLDISNLSVNLYSKKKILKVLNSDDLIITGYDSMKLGKQEITITYKEFSDTYMVMVLNYPEETPSYSSIEMYKLPNKLVYNIGEFLDTTGGILQINYNNGTYIRVNLMPLMTSEFSSNTAGIVRVRVDYVGFVTYFEVEVK